MITGDDDRFPCSNFVREEHAPALQPRNKERRHPVVGAKAINGPKKEDQLPSWLIWAPSSAELRGPTRVVEYKQVSDEINRGVKLIDERAHGALRVLETEKADIEQQRIVLNNAIDRHNKAVEDLNQALIQLNFMDWQKTLTLIIAAFTAVFIGLSAYAGFQNYRMQKKSMVPRCLSLPLVLAVTRQWD
jgi:hypothetical protein